MPSAPGSPFPRRNRISGGSSTPRHHDPPENSTDGDDRNPFAAAARFFRTCFAPSRSRSASDSRSRSGSDHFSDAFKSSSQATSASGSNYGSCQGTSKKLSVKGIYSSPSRAEPGGIRFTMAEIHKATKNFSPSLKVGQGGFGTVYKGMLENGMLVAVKRANKTVYDKQLGTEFKAEIQTVYDKQLGTEFKAEIQTLARVEHLNLVRFMGYLEHEDERILVVEYVPNGTLREHLDCLHGNILDLAARLDIVIDVAHALAYLHVYADHPIIHRDIKSSNILLTENFRAKVADFGFARLSASETGVTHICTQVKGTAGYLDPEYLKTFQLTDKSDVYSFGVLLVESITGRRPIEPKRDFKERLTPKWAMKKFMEGDAIQILDPNVPRTPASILALEKILELALQCLAPTRQRRPSMSMCAEILWSIRKDYREQFSSDVLLKASNQKKPSLLEQKI